MIACHPLKATTPCFFPLLRHSTNVSNRHKYKLGFFLKNIIFHLLVFLYGWVYFFFKFSFLFYFIFFLNNFFFSSTQFAFQCTNYGNFQRQSILNCILYYILFKIKKIVFLFFSILCNKLWAVCCIYCLWCLAKIYLLKNKIGFSHFCQTKLFTNDENNPKYR